MKSLAQNSVISVVNGEIIDGQVAHDPFIFAADINLRYRAKTAHRQPFDDAVRTAHIQGDVMHTAALLPCHLAAVL